MSMHYNIELTTVAGGYDRKTCWVHARAGVIPPSTAVLTTQKLRLTGSDFNDRVVAMLPMLGIAYARTCETRNDFQLPDDVYRWPMSCHQSRAPQRAEEFLRVPPLWGLQLFYVMGHSFEFGDDGWGDIEAFCQLMGDREDIWYATNIEIADYIQALRAIHVSADGDILTNPTAQPVWCSLWENGKPEETLMIETRQTVHLCER